MSPFHEDREPDYEPLYDTLYAVAPAATTITGAVIGGLIDTRLKYGQTLLLNVDHNVKQCCGTFHPYRSVGVLIGATLGILMDVFPIREYSPFNDEDNSDSGLTGGALPNNDIET